MHFKSVSNKSGNQSNTATTAQHSNGGTHGAHMEELFILADNGHLQPVTFERWQAWHRAGKRHLGNTVISFGTSSVHISTVFLARPDKKDPAGQPLLFESAVFGEVRDATTRTISADTAHYVDAASALAGHRAIVDGWLWFFEHTLRWPAEVVENYRTHHPVATAQCHA